MGVSTSLRTAWHQVCSVNSASAVGGSERESVDVIESESTGTDKLPGALDVISILYSQVRYMLYFAVFGFLLYCIVFYCVLYCTVLYCILLIVSTLPTYTFLKGVKIGMLTLYKNDIS